MKVWLWIRPQAMHDVLVFCILNRRECNSKSAFLPSAEHFYRRQFARGGNLTHHDRQDPTTTAATSRAIVALAAESPLSTAAALIRAAIGNEIKLIHSMRTGQAGGKEGRKEGGRRTRTPIPIRVTFIIAKTRSAYLALLTALTLLTLGRQKRSRGD